MSSVREDVNRNEKRINKIATSVTGIRHVLQGLAAGAQSAASAAPTLDLSGVEAEIKFNKEKIALNSLRLADFNTVAQAAQTGVHSLTGTIRTVSGHVTEIEANILNSEAKVARNKGQIDDNKAAIASLARNMEELRALVATIEGGADAGTSNIHRSLFASPKRIEVAPGALKIYRTGMSRLAQRIDYDGLMNETSKTYTGRIALFAHEFIPRVLPILVTTSDEKKTTDLNTYLATNPAGHILSVDDVHMDVGLVVAGGGTAFAPEMLEYPYQGPRPYASPAPPVETWVDVADRYAGWADTAIAAAEAFGWNLDPEVSVTIAVLRGLVGAVASAYDAIDSAWRGTREETEASVTGHISDLTQREYTKDYKTRNYVVKTTEEGYCMCYAMKVENYLANPNELPVAVGLNGVTYTEMVYPVGSQPSYMRAETHPGDVNANHDGGYGVNEEMKVTIKEIAFADSITKKSTGALTRYELKTDARVSLPLGALSVWYDNVLIANRTATTDPWTYFQDGTAKSETFKASNSAPSAWWRPA